MPTAWWKFLRPAVVLAWSRRRKQLTLPRPCRVWLTLVLSTFVCIGLMRVPAAANLVQNGDFSTGDLTGWSALQLSISGNYGGELTQVLIGPVPNPTVMATCFVYTTGCGVLIYTDAGWGAMVQTLVTVPGQSYRVQYVVDIFGGADVQGHKIAYGGFVPIFNGIGYVGANPLDDSGGFLPFPPLPPGSPIRPAVFLVRTYDETFVATATGNLTAIEFASTCPGCAFFITDVSVDPIPEPPSLFLFAAGLLTTWICIRCWRNRAIWTRLPAQDFRRWYDVSSRSSVSGFPMCRKKRCGMKAVSIMLQRLPGCSSLFAAAVLVIGLDFALPASAPAASFIFTPFDVPGASGTQAYGINDTGQIVGPFQNSGTRGFLDTGGVFTTIDPPGAFFTQAFGINDKGQIVGSFGDETAKSHGFLYTGGVFTTIDPPGASYTQALGINDKGQIVGIFFDATGAHGFLDTDGVFATIDAPGATTGTVAQGINDAGQIVGSFSNGTGVHGFLDSGGVFTTIDVPGFSHVPGFAYTAANGINDAGQIVGSFLGFDVRQRGFLDTGGVFTIIEVHGALATLANGINARGQIVGFFDDGRGTHGFVATPTAVPAPSTLLLLGTGLAFGAAWKRVRKGSGLDRKRSAFAPRSFLPNH